MFETLVHLLKGYRSGARGNQEIEGLRQSLDEGIIIPASSPREIRDANCISVEKQTMLMSTGDRYRGASPLQVLMDCQLRTPRVILALGTFPRWYQSETEYIEDNCMCDLELSIIDSASSTSDPRRLIAFLTC